MAWDGKTGEVLWSISTYNEVFELNCGNIDINQDGRMDCLGAGRKGTLISFDYQTGEQLWEPQSGTETYLNHEWNIYNPLGWYLRIVLGILREVLKIIQSVFFKFSCEVYPLIIIFCSS